LTGEPLSRFGPELGREWGVIHPRIQIGRGDSLQLSALIQSGEKERPLTNPPEIE